MKLRIFLPLVFISVTGCDLLENKNESQSLKQRYDEKGKTEVVEKIIKSDHDQAVVPNTDYPSIFEVEFPKTEVNSSVTDNKKAKKVLDLGTEKIKVYDESMGSVNETSLKKLRKQVK